MTNKLIDIDGRRFEGEHKNDKRSHGTFYWPEGSIYVGDYCESHRDGRGKFTWPDGDSFEGEWKKGGRFGSGVFTCVQKGDLSFYNDDVISVKLTFDRSGRIVSARELGRGEF